ncbi:MAG: histidinol dehydrogenase [Chloroflexota bacterium]|nr:histidinol dehydrogenase [Chloroflexota bacterium]
MKKIIGKIESAKYVESVLRSFSKSADLESKCNQIIDEVRKNKDKALKFFSQEFDKSKREFELTEEEIEKMFNKVDKGFLESVEKSISRSEDFHTNSKPQSWINDSGSLGENIIPFDRVLCYVPGGTAPLVSTAIMTVVPARIAGVKEICVTSPAPNDEISPELIVAARLAGANRIFCLGGVHALAAFSVGTDKIPKVDFICGPGNKYVTQAKKILFGTVGIDGLYGPTETLIIADSKSDPDLVASDLIAQAEHDIEATPILITDKESFADRVEKEIEKQTISLERSNIIKESFSRKGAAFIIEDIDETLDLCNLIAAEHVSVISNEIKNRYREIRNAGGLFLGDESAEVFGDYIAGPSHVMPTGGSARFGSALNVRQFMKYQPLINLSSEEVINLVDDVVKLAEIERLQGHAESAKNRKKKAIGE